MLYELIPAVMASYYYLYVAVLIERGSRESGSPGVSASAVEALSVCNKRNVCLSHADAVMMPKRNAGYVA
jgi:hypothetical protein